MKKITALICAMVMVLHLTACGGAPATDSKGTGDSVSSAGSTALSYPHKRVTMIIPYGAGGTADLVGRQLGMALGEVLGVSVVVENQPGASASIGCQAALDAKADGSTILFTAETLGTQRIMGISQLSYADFSPIMAVADDPKVMVVAKDSPYQTVEELLSAMEQAPNTIQMAYTGPGGSGHIQALILNQFGYRPALTAYASGADGIVAVMSKQVVFTNANYSSVASYIDSGDLKLLAVCANERMEGYPDIPALSEIIEGSEEDMDTPYTPLSLLVAKDVPEELKETLRAACVQAVKSPEFNQFMEDNHINKLYELYQTVDEISAFYAKWESAIAWMIYEAGAATYSPEKFGIPKPAV